MTESDGDGDDDGLADDAVCEGAPTEVDCGLLLDSDGCGDAGLGDQTAADCSGNDAAAACVIDAANEGLSFSITQRNFRYGGQFDTLQTLHIDGDGAGAGGSSGVSDLCSDASSYDGEFEAGSGGSHSPSPGGRALTVPPPPNHSGSSAPALVWYRRNVVGTLGRSLLLPITALLVSACLGETRSDGGEEIAGTSTGDPSTVGSGASSSSGGSVSDGGFTSVEPGSGTDGGSSIGSSSSSSGVSDEAGSSTAGSPPLLVDCDPDLLADFEISFEIHRSQGEDRSTAMRPGYACLDSVSNEFDLRFEFGEPFLGEYESAIRVRATAGAGLYDLETDVGTSGTMRIGYVHRGYATHSYDTVNQPAVGTALVESVPTQSGEDLVLSAVGELAGDDGWEFSFDARVTQPRAPSGGRDK